MDCTDADVVVRTMTWPSDSSTMAIQMTGWKMTWPLVAGSGHDACRTTDWQGDCALTGLVRSNPKVRRGPITERHVAPRKRPMRVGSKNLLHLRRDRPPDLPDEKCLHHNALTNVPCVLVVFTCGEIST